MTGLPSSHARAVVAQSHETTKQLPQVEGVVMSFMAQTHKQQKVPQVESVVMSFNVSHTTPAYMAELPYKQCL